MKTLIFLTIFIITSFVGYSQITSLQVFQYQEVFINSVDTNYSKPFDVNLTYIFDFTNHNVTANMNGKVLKENITLYTNENGVITLVYTDNASAGWILDTLSKKATYFEIRKDIDYSCEMTRVIFY
jgi:hypothetical protein